MYFLGSLHILMRYISTGRTSQRGVIPCDPLDPRSECCKGLWKDLIRSLQRGSGEGHWKKDRVSKPVSYQLPYWSPCWHNHFAHLLWNMRGTVFCSKDDEKHHHDWDYELAGKVELSLSIHHKSRGRTECEFCVEDQVLSFRKLGCPENSFYNLLTWVLLLFYFANEEIEELRGQLVQVKKLLSGRARF